jgi:uncharacterized protein (TIGR02594 family)
MAKFIAATFDKPTLTVDYVADDGSHLLRTGGTIAWRFNNPGNLRPAGTNASIRIGIGKTANGEFCIFPSYEVGRRAKKELLRRKYDKYTIPEALEIYAPRSENDTDAYVEHIIQKTGLPRDKPLSEFSDAQLDAMMDAMESKEGFNAKREMRKEKWVHTTQLTLSDGSQPIAGEEVKVDFSGKEYVTKTNGQGAIPPIVHMSDDVSVEISLKNMRGAWDCVYAFVTGQKSRQLLATLDHQIYRGTTRMAITATKPTTPAAQKPLVYVVQSGDNLTKIANKFKTTVADLRKSNQGIIKENLIFPGQRISVYGFAGAQAAAPVSSTAPAHAHPKVAEATKPVSSSKGQPLALVDHAQRRAPWMDVAIREARQWAGSDEKVITKTDNYHRELSLSGQLNTVPWCASFVNFSLKEAGYPFEKSASSQFPVRSKKFIKIERPVYGALMVWKKGSEGHIAFAYAKDSVSGEVIALGGNQNDRITFMLMTETSKKFQGYYIPAVLANSLVDLGELEDFDIVKLNREVAGNAAYKRKVLARDR